jgi:hypothetical protein
MKNLILKTEPHHNTLGLVIEGECKVQNSFTLREFLLESVCRAGDETLILTHVTALDISGFQLIYLWKQRLESQSRRANISLPLDKGLTDLLEKTGITKIL